MAIIEWGEVTIGGFLLLALIIVILVWAGRHDTTKLVRFGFFFERKRDEKMLEQQEDAITRILPRKEEE